MLFVKLNRGSWVKIPHSESCCIVDEITLCHWETGKAGYAGAGAMLPIREPEDLQKEKHFAIF